MAGQAKEGPDRDSKLWYKGLCSEGWGGAMTVVSCCIGQLCSHVVLFPRDLGHHSYLTYTFKYVCMYVCIWEDIFVYGFCTK